MLFVLFVAAASLAAGSRDLRSLVGPGNDSPYSLEDFSDLPVCKVAATATIVSFTGTTTASSSANCQVKVEAVNAVQRTMKEWLETAQTTPKEACTENEVMAVSKNVARAVASAYADAEIQLETDGVGRACGSAEAEADGYGVIFAKAILREPVLKAVVSSGDDGLCLAGALSAVFARAWESLKTRTCIDGPDRFEGKEESFAESVEEAVARVVGEIAREVCVTRKGQRKVERLMKSLKTEEVDAEASAETLLQVVDGVAEASGGTLVQCTGEGSADCCGASPSDKCEWKPKMGLMWKTGRGQKCCCLDGLLPYVHLDE